MPVESLVKSHTKDLVKVLAGLSFETSGFPVGLLSLYAPVYSGDGTVSLVGVQPSYAYAGNQYNETGQSVGEIPVIHNSFGVWVGPAHTNILPALAWSFNTSNPFKGPWTLSANAGGAFTVLSGLLPGTMARALYEMTAGVEGITELTDYVFTLRLVSFRLADGFSFKIGTGSVQNVALPIANTTYHVPYTTAGGETDVEIQIWVHQLGDAGTVQSVSDSVTISAQVTEGILKLPYGAGQTVCAAAVSDLTYGLNFLMDDEFINLYKSKVNENYIENSHDFITSAEWNNSSCTVKTDYGDYARLTQTYHLEPPFEKNMIFSSNEIDTLVGKTITSYFRLRAISSGVTEKTFFNLRIYLLSVGSGELVSHLTNVGVGLWTTIRLDPVAITDNDVYVIVENYTDDLPLIIDFEYCLLAESITPAFYNTGTSISLGAFVQGGNGIVPSLNYSALVADELGIEYVNNAKGNAFMTDIQSEAITEFATLPSGETYPMVFFDSSGPEFVDGWTLANVKTGFTSLLNTMLANSDFVVYLLMPLGPALDDEYYDSVTPDYEIGLEFNEWVKSTYGSTSGLTLIDPMEVLVRDYVDFSTRDGRHPTTTGQAKIAALVLESLAFPLADIEQRAYTKTEGTAITGEIISPPMTTAALVTVQMSSAEMVGDALTLWNVLTSKDSAETLLYQENHATVEASSIIAGSADGSSTPSILTGTWGEKVEILLVVQVNNAGTQYRVGYSKNMTAMTWDSWTNYDGSFVPLDRLRVGYTNGMPMWIKQVQVWNKGASDPEILGIVNTYSE